MHIQWKYLLSLLCVVSYYCNAGAQAAAPTSGDITVKMIQGLDSVRDRPGAKSQANVTKSTNPAVPKNSSAVVQLVVTPEGSLGVQLVQLSTKTGVVKVSGSNAVLAPDWVEQVQIRTRQAGAPKNSVTGPRIFLPTETSVRFTLGDPGSQPLPAPVQHQRADAPEPPTVWQPTSTPFGDPQPGDAAVGMTVLAVNGAKHGHAHLIVSCTGKKSLSAWFTVAQPLLGYKVDDFNNVNEPGSENAMGALRFEGADTKIFLAGNSGDDSPVRLSLGGPPNGLPDVLYAASSAGKPVRFTISAPDGKGTPTVVNFLMPADPAPLMAVASVCFAGQAAEAAEIKAKIVASCPEKPGKTLVSGLPKRVPAGKPFDSDSNEGTGDTWYLTSPALRPGQHAVLVCTYGPPGATVAPKVVPPADRVSIPLPASAVSCAETHDPYAVTCSRK